MGNCIRAPNGEGKTANCSRVHPECAVDEEPLVSPSEPSVKDHAQHGSTKEHSVCEEVPSLEGYVRQVTPPWTEDMAQKLQDSVDRVFGTEGKSLMGLAFSFTIADPFIDGCPLIGCSSGFTGLCGYSLEEIVGRNCRFLLDPVPSELINQRMRKHTKLFCEAQKCGNEYTVPLDEREHWMPTTMTGDELWCLQRNARKDGSLFNNLFLLKTVFLGIDLGDEAPYIVGLQSEAPEGKEALGELSSNHKTLAVNLGKVLSEMAETLFVQTLHIQRQEASI